MSHMGLVKSCGAKAESTAHIHNQPETQH